MRIISILVGLVIGSLIGIKISKIEAKQFLGNSGSTTVTSCGTSPSVNGDNTKGVITVGTGVVTSCALNFSHTLSVTPACVFSPSAAVIPSASITASIATISLSATLGGGKIYYWCFDPTPRF